MEPTLSKSASQLTEDRVREIVREEMAADREADRQRMLADRQALSVFLDKRREVREPSIETPPPHRSAVLPAHDQQLGGRHD